MFWKNRGRNKMGILKVGCTGIIVVSAAIGIAVYMLNSRDGKPPKVDMPQTEENKEKTDPTKRKFGMTEEEIKSYADRDVKAIVRKHLHLKDTDVISSWNNALHFWEYDLYDKESKKMIGPFAGVNIRNKFSSTDAKGQKRENEYSATYRYDPAKKEWSIRSLSINGTILKTNDSSE